MFKKITLIGVALTALSACAITPEQFESAPVLAQSPAGPVTCQIYTHEQVTWDRSIGRPGSVSVAAADELCRQEGHRIMQGGTPNYAPTTTIVTTGEPL